MAHDPPYTGDPGDPGWSSPTGPPGQGSPGAAGWQPAGGWGPPPAAGPTNRHGQVLADWWQRAAAIVIDLVLLSIAKAIVAAVIFGVTVSTGLVAPTLGAAVLVVGIVFAIVDIAYFAFLNGSPRGQTVGQILLGIAVRDSATGGPIDPKRAAIRIVVLIPALAIGWIPLLAFLADLYTIVAVLSPLWDRGRLGFHDKVAHTEVVRVR